MLLHCDLVFVANDAKLTTPFVNLALVPEAASSMLMPARIGHARSFAMFALGDGFTGQEAAQLGLANAALPKEQVIPAAREAAKKLALRPMGAVMAAKNPAAPPPTTTMRLCSAIRARCGALACPPSRKTKNRRRPRGQRRWVECRGVARQRPPGSSPHPLIASSLSDRRQGHRDRVRRPSEACRQISSSARG